MTTSEKLMHLFSEMVLYWFKELEEGKIEVIVKNETKKVFNSFESLEIYLETI